MSYLYTFYGVIGILLTWAVVNLFWFRQRVNARRQQEADHLARVHAYKEKLYAADLARRSRL